MSKLHPKQVQLLGILKDHRDSPLTIKDLRLEVGIDSPGVLYHHLRQLEKRGFIKRNPQNSRDYIVLDSPEKSVDYIPKYGAAQCGPKGDLLDETPEAFIPISPSLLRFPASDAFIVVAAGDSMENKIHDGDMVIAKRQDFGSNGDVVVCTLNEQVKIKKIISANGKIHLYSLNTKYLPIPVSEDDDFSIAGVVMNIFSYKF